MNKTSLSALAAAGLLAGSLATGANAADLGGNCCADLEERIAELEATTARKGNRKVSLTVSGWVSQMVTWWDNDDGSDTYVHDAGSTLGSNVKFTGQATIVPGWTAGYVLHMELMGSDSLTMDETTSHGPALYSGILSGTSGYNSVQTLQSYWFIKSDHWGKVSVGLQSSAADNAAILVDGSGSLVPANWVAFDYRAFGSGSLAGGAILGGASCGTMGGAVGDCMGLTQNAVRYDSPTFAGFSASASWGADDFWDMTLRYAGELHGFKVAAAVAYTEVDDDNFNNLGVIAAAATDAEYFQTGVYVQHIGTGLFGLVNYGDFDDNVAGVSNETWYFKGGIRRNWNHLGATVLYGEYETVEDAYDGTGDFQLWGLGAVQEIDAAAMSLWIKYRDIEANATAGDPDFEHQYFQFGALINF